MFARADQLRIKDIQNNFRLHAIEYYWDDFEPKLIYFDLDDGQMKTLDIYNIDFSVSKKKICIGSFVDDEYIPCPGNFPVSRFAQCAECGESLIPIQECLFEPKCEGDQCESPICKRDHAVYIAFFGDLPKVGMSMKSRVKNRLIEQGADAYFIAGYFPTRKSAREREKQIAEKLRITDRSKGKNVLESLRLLKKRSQIEDARAWISQSLRERFSMDPGELEFLDSYPLEEPLPEIPKLTESWGNHSGKFVGIKGKYLIYERERILALNLADLPSRFISRESL